MAKYITFQKADDPFHEKPVYWIINKTTLQPLGQIVWYKPWRRWCATFDENSIWSEDCLADLRAYILTLKD